MFWFSYAPSLPSPCYRFVTPASFVCLLIEDRLRGDASVCCARFSAFRLQRWQRAEARTTNKHSVPVDVTAHKNFEDLIGSAKGAIVNSEGRQPLVADHTNTRPNGSTVRRVTSTAIHLSRCIDMRKAEIFERTRHACYAITRDLALLPANCPRPRRRRDGCGGQRVEWRIAA